MHCSIVNEDCSKGIALDITSSQWDSRHRTANVVTVNLVCRTNYLLLSSYNFKVYQMYWGSKI